MRKGQKRTWFTSGFTGHKHSQKSRLKMNISRTGKPKGPMSEGTKRKIGLANRGKHTGRKHWKGGKPLDSKGYRLVYNPLHPYRNKWNYVLEHRIVMEHSIGRYLKPEERVGHKDGNKLNNDISNLILFQSVAEQRRYVRIQNENKRKVLENIL